MVLMVMVSVTSMVMINILVVVLMAMSMVPYPDRKTNFTTSQVPGVDEEVPLSIMKRDGSLYLEDKPSKIRGVLHAGNKLVFKKALSVSKSNLGKWNCWIGFDYIL